MKTGNVFAALLVALGFAGMANAQSTMTLDITTGEDNWQISGRNEAELIEHLNSHMIMRTDYSFEIQAYPYFDQRAGEGCWLAGGSMTAHTIISAPEWTDYERANRSLRRRWDAYVEQVRLHSEGHLEISRQGAAIVAQRLEAVPPQAGCNALQARFDETVSALIDALQVSHRDYDRQSGGMPRISRPLPIRR